MFHVNLPGCIQKMISFSQGSLEGKSFVGNFWRGQKPSPSSSPLKRSEKEAGSSPTHPFFRARRIQAIRSLIGKRPANSFKPRAPVFVCNVCNLPLGEAPNGKRFSSPNIIKLANKTQTSLWALNGEKALLSAAALHPKEQPACTCPKCGAGLPHLKKLAIKTHLAACVPSEEERLALRKQHSFRCG